MARKSDGKASGQDAGLGVKALTDEKLVDVIKARIAELTVFINEADKRDIAVDFSIRKPPHKLKGGFRVAQCDITRRL